MIGATGIWDGLFGKRIEITMPDGSKRRVTTKWFNERIRKGQAVGVRLKWADQAEALREASALANYDAKTLVKYPDKHVEALASQILMIAANEVSELCSSWKGPRDDKTQHLIYAEYTVLLISYVDRLAYQAFGDPMRTKFMNDVIDRIASGIVGVKSSRAAGFVETHSYEKIISVRMAEYSSLKDLNKHVFIAASLFVETYCTHIPEVERPQIVRETAMSMFMAIMIATAVLPSFKALLRK